MKNDMSLAFFTQWDGLSPEAQRAQRLAELKDIAEYKRRHLEAIKAWSDPNKRAAIQSQYHLDEVCARIEWDYDEYLKSQPPPKSWLDYARITPINKQPPKKRWHDIIFGWI